MKRLFTIAVLLAVAPMLNAALLVNSNVAGTDVLPTDAVTFDIIGDGSASGNAYWLIAQGAGELQGGSLLYTGSLATLTNYGTGGVSLSELGTFFDDIGFAGVTSALYIELVDGSATPKALTGTLVSGINFVANGQGAAGVKLLSVDGSEVIGMKALNVVPEPATMALLGLGGLFFARKK